MKINSINSNQNFGSLIIPRSTETLLKGRIKRQSDFSKLEKLVQAQKNNSVNVTISSYDTCSPNYPDVLVAYIDYFKHGENHRKCITDSPQNIDNPLKLIRKACKKADKISKKLAKAEDTI